MKMSAIAAAIAIAVGGGGGAHAQGYPSHPITMIVPFPAGGPTDTLARVLGERMRVSLGQPVIIETVTGAGASIGVARAAQAAPDGYTLSIGNWTSHVGAGASIFACFTSSRRPARASSSFPTAAVRR